MILKKNIKIDNFLTNQNEREDKIRKFRNPLVINQQKLKVLKENIMNNFMPINYTIQMKQEKSPESHQLLKLTQEELENLRPITRD